PCATSERRAPRRRHQAPQASRPPGGAGCRQLWRYSPLMAQRKAKSLSPVRRSLPELQDVEAPQRATASVSEQKINQYRKRRYQALHSDTNAANKRRAAGKATARDRIEMLVDEGSFVELDLFATNRAYGFGMEDKRIAGDGVVAGFGDIDG